MLERALYQTQWLDKNCQLLQTSLKGYAIVSLEFVLDLNISLQMILYDTPGIIEKKMHKLDSMKMNNVRSAGVNADCVLVVVDACNPPHKIDEILEEGVGALKDKAPVLLVLNKKDLIKPGEVAKKLEWYEKFTEVDEVIPVSAKYGKGIDEVQDWILSKLPFGPAYYLKATFFTTYFLTSGWASLSIEIIQQEQLMQLSKKKSTSIRLQEGKYDFTSRFFFFISGS